MAVSDSSWSILSRGFALEEAEGSVEEGYGEGAGIGEEEEKRKAEAKGNGNGKKDVVREEAKA